MLSKLLKMRLSPAWTIVALFILVGLGLLIVSLNTLLGEPMLTAVQLGAWYGPFLPSYWP